MKENKDKITRKTNLAEAIDKYPEMVEVLMDYGLHCVGCVASAYDTVENGARAHGLSDDEINEMVAKANEVIEHGE